MTRNTKRADRHVLVAAGKRYHAAKMQWLYGLRSVGELEYDAASRALLHAAECYVMGRRKASVEWGHRHYDKSKRAAA